MEGRELDGGRVRAAEAQRREERLGRAHGDAATNSRLVNDVIPQGKTRFAATITGSTAHNDDDVKTRRGARAVGDSAKGVNTELTRGNKISFVHTLRQLSWAIRHRSR